MRRPLRGAALVLLALLAYLVFLAATVPAAVAWQMVDGRTPLRVYAPAGTLWEGTAAAVMDGPRRLDAVRWSVTPASVLTASPRVRVSGSVPGGGVEASVRVSPGGTARVTDGRVEMDVDTLLAWIGRGGFAPLADGRVEALVRELVMSEGRLSRADGLLSWNGAHIGGESGIPLGDLAVRLEPAGEGATRGEVAASDGPLDISGTLSLSPEGEFQGEIRIRPSDPGSADSRRAASFLGLANPDGTTVVNLQGNVDGTGFRLQQRAG